MDVGQGQYQEKFFMGGRSVGQRGVGQQRALSDGGFVKNYLVLE